MKDCVSTHNLIEPTTHTHLANPETANLVIECGSKEEMYKTLAKLYSINTKTL